MKLYTRDPLGPANSPRIYVVYCLSACIIKLYDNFRDRILCVYCKCSTEIIKIVSLTLFLFLFLFLGRSPSPLATPCANTSLKSSPFSASVTRTDFMAYLFIYIYFFQHIYISSTSFVPQNCREYGNILFVTSLLGCR